MAERRHVRVVGQPIDPDWNGYGITVDLTLQDDKAVERRPYFGCMRPVNESWPIVLHADGCIDFGSEYKVEQERYYKTNILKKEISLGNQFTITQRISEDSYIHEDVVYAIRQIVDL